MSRTTDAYAAGLIDGEGCIGIFSSKKSRSYSIRVQIGMTTKASAVLQQMQKVYGGNISLWREATERWDSAETWTVSGAEAATVLRRVSPYLRLKGEQAQIALKVQEIRDALPEKVPGRKEWTPEATVRCATLKARMHELNRKGPSTSGPVSGSMIARLVASHWVTDQTDLLSDLGWAPFSGAWPASGSLRSGRAFARRRSALPTSESAFSSSPGGQLLPTPRASDTGTPGRRASEGYRPPLSQVVLPLLPTPTATPYGSNQSPSPGAAVRPSLDSLAPKLLPTPRATDGTKGGPNQRGSSGDLTLPSAAHRIGAATALPSPAGLASSDDRLPGQLTIADA